MSEITLDTYDPKPKNTAKSYIKSNLERIQKALRKTHKPNWEEVYNLVLAEEDAPEKMTLSSFITYFYQAGGRIKKEQPHDHPSMVSLPIAKRR
jgi:hypothetical protein